MFWSGFNTSTGGDFLSRLVLFDDNLTHGVSLPEPQGQVGSVTEVRSHYAVDWVEVYEDGTFSALVSERSIICMWPQATIAKSVTAIGSLEGISHSQSTRKFKTPSVCKGCKIDVDSVVLSITINYDKLTGRATSSSSSSSAKKIVSYGGLHWEAMKYIAGNSGAILANLPDGWHGTMGDNACPGNMTGFRFDATPSTIQQIRASGSLYSTSSSELVSVLSPLTSLARIVDIQFAGVSDGELAARRAAFAHARSTNNDDFHLDCCSAPDADFLNAGCCPGPHTTICPNGDCCPDHIVVNGKTINTVCGQDGTCVTEEFYCRP